MTTEQMIFLIVSFFIGVLVGTIQERYRNDK